MADELTRPSFGVDWIGLFQQQRSVALTKWGWDTLNPTADFAHAPITPAGYAGARLKVYTDLLKGHVQWWASHWQWNSVVATRHNISRAERSLRNALIIERRLVGGEIILPNQDAQIFWDALKKVAMEYSAKAFTLISTDEYAAAFADGANDGWENSKDFIKQAAMDAGDAAGEAIAVAAEAAGRGTGAGLSSFIKELGVIGYVGVGIVGVYGAKKAGLF